MKRKMSLLLAVMTAMSIVFCACGDAGAAGKAAQISSSDKTAQSSVKETNSSNKADVSAKTDDKGAKDTSDDTGNVTDPDPGSDDPGAGPDDSGNVPDPGEPGGSADSNTDGEYTLEYILSYGYKDEPEGRYIYGLDGNVTVGGEQRITDLDWYNKSRPMVYAMFFPDLFGERVCQVFMDFAVFDNENEVFINLPYDSPNGTFNNDEVLQYDNLDAVDNGGTIRIEFPITINGLGSDTMTISDPVGITYVFNLLSKQ